MRNTSDYAGPWVRFGAIVVDLAVLSVVFFVATRIVKGTWLMSASDHRWASGLFITDPLCLTFLAVMFLYFVVLEAWFGATVGKRIVRLRVTGCTGTMGLRRSLVRNVLRVVDSLPVLGIMALVLISTSEERTRFGDRVAGTRVLHTRR